MRPGLARLRRVRGQGPSCGRCLHPWRILPPPGESFKQGLPPSFAWAQQRKLKDAKREERKSEKAQRGPRQPGDVDPDIAGIVPGPQPQLEEEPRARAGQIEAARSNRMREWMRERIPDFDSAAAPEE